MVRYLLDTIVFIWAVRGLHSADRVLERLAGEDVAVSAITVLELRRALTPEEFLSAENSLDGVDVLPIDADTARAAGEYLARCTDEGHRVDFFAGLIAVTAERHERELITYSPAHYPLAGCELLPLAAFLDGDA